MYESQRFAEAGAVSGEDSPCLRCSLVTGTGTPVGGQNLSFESGILPDIAATPPPAGQFSRRDLSAGNSTRIRPCDRVVRRGDAPIAHVCGPCQFNVQCPSFTHSW